MQYNYIVIIIKLSNTGTVKYHYCIVHCQFLQLFFFLCAWQELEKMAAELTEQKKNVEDAAKNLRDEKDTTEL